MNKEKYSNEQIDKGQEVLIELYESVRAEAQSAIKAKILSEDDSRKNMGMFEALDIFEQVLDGFNENVMRNAEKIKRNQEDKHE